jgi:hypothetical protein
VSCAAIGPSAGACGFSHDAQVDHVEHLEAKIAEVVVHGRFQFRGRGGRKPGCVVAAPGADLGDDDEIVRIGMQRLADQGVGHVRAVEVAGVDMVHAGGDGLAQHGERRVAILGRAEHAGPGELHGAIAEPLHAAAAEGESAGLLDVQHGDLLGVETTST